MQKKFLDYLINECNCSDDANYLVAVSGGIDSVVMAYLFRNSDIRFSIAHCNFQLRGDESECDQQFVEDLAYFFGVPCYVKKFDTRDYSEKERLSIQVAARNLRYGWFREVAETGRMDFISIGHNRDDNIETFLINLSRGTGIRGLSGIKPRNGNIIRPLLYASRNEIIKFAEENNIRWRNDSSNDSSKYQRNVIRNSIIPGFEKIYPAFRNNVSKTIRNLKQAEALYNESLQSRISYLTSNGEGRLYIDILKLEETGDVETVLYEILKDYGCNQAMAFSIADTLRSTPGRHIITKSHTITRDRKYLIVTENAQMPDDDFSIDTMTEMITCPFEMTFSVLPDVEKYTTESSRASLDYDKLVFPLKLRRWKEGDRFNPLGMKGTKKVSDYLIDHKIPLPDKQNIWVLESGGDIAWLVGHRIDDRYKVTAITKKIFLAEFSSG